MCIQYFLRTRTRFLSFLRAAIFLFVSPSSSSSSSPSSCSCFYSGITSFDSGITAEGKVALHPMCCRRSTFSYVRNLGHFLISFMQEAHDPPGNTAPYVVLLPYKTGFFFCALCAHLRASYNKREDPCAPCRTSRATWSHDKCHVACASIVESDVWSVRFGLVRWGHVERERDAAGGVHGDTWHDACVLRRKVG